MSHLHKSFDHALARIGTYLFGQTSNDHTTNVKANIVVESKSLECDPDSFRISLVRRNCGRFDLAEVMEEREKEGDQAEEAKYEE